MSIHSRLYAPLQDYDLLPFTAGADLTAGTFVEVGSIVGVVVEDVLNTAEGLLIIGTPADGMLVTKATSLAITLGDALYYDATNNRVNKTDTNPFFGFATAAAASDATTVKAIFTKAANPRPGSEA